MVPVPASAILERWRHDLIRHPKIQNQECPERPFLNNVICRTGRTEPTLHAVGIQHGSGPPLPANRIIYFISSEGNLVHFSFSIRCALTAGVSGLYVVNRITTSVLFDSHLPS
jgi:hypothetical protein